MNERTELRASIERTQEALAEKAQLLEARVSHARQRVVHALDVRGQYRARPWPFVLGALLAGLATGALSSASAGHALRDD